MMVYAFNYSKQMGSFMSTVTLFAPNLIEYQSKFGWWLVVQVECMQWSTRSSLQTNHLANGVIEIRSQARQDELNFKAFIRQQKNCLDHWYFKRFKYLMRSVAVASDV